MLIMLCLTIFYNKTTLMQIQCLFFYFSNKNDTNNFVLSDFDQSMFSYKLKYIIIIK